MFDQELECCGAEFEKSHISLLGLLTLSFPLVILLTVLKIILFPIILMKKISIIDSLINVNHKLIRQKNILSRYKCNLASAVFKVSPRLSGLIFKYFNFSILVFIWTLIILVIFKVV
ncbi:hypothetical protein BIY24_15355 [Halobacteriovorax marinus]|nr:hypothetical protein BIY24_15355 [Halobacteriovorax marinus]